MYNTPEQVTEFNKSVVNAALQLTKIVLDTTERFVGLQLEASKASFDDASQTLRTLTEARDPQQAVPRQPHEGAEGLRGRPQGVVEDRDQRRKSSESAGRHIDRRR